MAYLGRTGVSRTMRFLRTLGASVTTTLLWAAGVSAGLGGCGGPPEVVKSPEPAKVMWGNSESAPEAPSAPEETPEPPVTASTERGGGPVEIDLDAPPAGEGSTSAEKVKAEEEEPTPDAPPAAESARPLEKEMRAAVKSKEEKPTKPKKSVAKKSAPAAPAAPTFTGSNPCKAPRFSVARVGDACATGGRSGAKAVMKEAIGKALASGTTLKCSDCHAEQRDYTLKPDAVAQLEKWLDG